MNEAQQAGLQIDWAGLAPMIIVFVAAFGGLLVEATVPKSRRLVVQVGLAVLALAAAFVAVVLNAGSEWRAQALRWDSKQTGPAEQAIG